MEKRKAKPPSFLCSSCLGKEEELAEEEAGKETPRRENTEEHHGGCGLSDSFHWALRAGTSTHSFQ